MTTALYVVAILAGLALVLALALCKASAKPTPHAEPIRRTPGGWRT